MGSLDVRSLVFARSKSEFQHLSVLLLTSRVTNHHRLINTGGLWGAHLGSAGLQTCLAEDVYRGSEVRQREVMGGSAPQMKDFCLAINYSGGSGGSCWGFLLVFPPFSMVSWTRDDLSSYLGTKDLMFAQKSHICLWV